MDIIIGRNGNDQVIVEHNDQEFITGDRITCKIEGEPIKDARIRIIVNNRNILLYICQNVTDGQSCSDMFGYMYSWVCEIYNTDDDFIINNVTEFKKYDSSNDVYDISEKISKAISRAFPTT